MITIDKIMNDRFYRSSARTDKLSTYTMVNRSSINRGSNNSKKFGNNFLFFCGYSWIMLVECPHCAGEVEIEPESGSVFECPLCASDFEVESNPAVGVDYSPHFWGPALDTAYPEHCLDYIARVNGELPEDRLIQVSSDSHSEIAGVVLTIIGIITIPVLIVILLVHVVKNSKKEYQDFFWVKKWRHYFDPSQKAIITIRDYKNGSYPTQVAYLERYLMISKHTLSEGQGTYYTLELNLKQNLRFEYEKDAKACRETIRSALQNSGYDLMLPPHGTFS